MAIFCTIYYILAYAQSIPQIVKLLNCKINCKLLKTKSSNDYSLGMITLQFISIACWSVYVFTSKQSIIVYIGTVGDLLRLIFVDFLIFKYYKNKENADDRNHTMFVEEG